MAPLKPASYANPPSKFKTPNALSITLPVLISSMETVYNVDLVLFWKEEIVLVP